jgi:predicted CopG family antitoxin
MANADKRIPVTEERWKQLHDLKGPGQTFDELIEDLVEERKKQRLFRDMNRIREESEFEPLEEV